MFCKNFFSTFTHQIMCFCCLSWMAIKLIKHDSSKKLSIALTPEHESHWAIKQSTRFLYYLLILPAKFVIISHHNLQYFYTQLRIINISFKAFLIPETDLTLQFCMITAQYCFLSWLSFYLNFSKPLFGVIIAANDQRTINYSFFMNCLNSFKFVNPNYF